MDQLALIDDMHRATERIVEARLPICIRAVQAGLVVEAPACATTRLVAPLQATLTWAELEAASRPLIAPLTRKLISFLRDGGRPPTAFRPVSLGSLRSVH